MQPGEAQPLAERTGAAVTEALRRCHVSPAELCNALECSRTWLRRVQDGHCDVKLTQLERIAQHLPGASFDIVYSRTVREYGITVGGPRRWVQPFESPEMIERAAEIWTDLGPVQPVTRVRTDWLPILSDPV